MPLREIESRREVGVEIGAQQAIEAPDAGRHAGADGGAKRGTAGPVPAPVAAGDRPPGALGRARGTPRHPALGEAEGEAVDGPQYPLVVGRAGPARAAAPTARIDAAAAMHSSRGRLMWQSM